MKEIQPSYETMLVDPNSKYAKPIEPQASLLSIDNRGIADVVSIAKPPSRKAKDEPVSDLHRDTSMGIGIFFESRLLQASLDLYITIGVSIKTYLVKPFHAIRKLLVRTKKAPDDNVFREKS